MEEACISSDLIIVWTTQSYRIASTSGHAKDLGINRQYICNHKESNDARTELCTELGTPPLKLEIMPDLHKKWGII